jgi:hypothetical protein
LIPTVEQAILIHIQMNVTSFSRMRPKLDKTLV